MNADIANVIVQFCRGGRTISGGEPCDCEEYDPPDDSTAAARCKECGHGKSKHSLPPSSSLGHGHRLAVPPDSYRNSQSTGGGSSASVRKIFNDVMAEESASSGKGKQRASKSGYSKVSADAARKEVLQGFRKDPAVVDTASSSGSTKKSEKVSCILMTV